MAKSAVEQVKNSDIYKTASYKVQEQITNVKRSESYQKVSDSEAGKVAGSFFQNLKKEWKQSKTPLR